MSVRQKLKRNKLLLIAFLFSFHIVIGYIITSSNIVYSQTIRTDKVELHAEIREENTRYGTAPFDNSDGNGFDSNDRNQIVRSFDQAEYQIQATVNPIDQNISNVKIRIFGTLENGVTDNGRRVNAIFSHPDSYVVLDPNDDSRHSEAVSAIDTELTLTQTGQAISIGLPIQVQGAKNGLVIRPNVSIQLMEIEGEDVSNQNLIERLDAPSFTVSSQVSFSGFAHFPNGSAADTVGAEFANDSSDPGSYKLVGTSFYLVPIDGTNSTTRPVGRELLGATFPTGKIEFEYQLWGEVRWFSEATEEHPDGQQLDSERMRFSGAYEKAQIAHYGPISNPMSQRHIGKSGLYWSGQNILTRGWQRHGTGFSYMGAVDQLEEPDLSMESIRANYRRSVWDSGQWSVGSPELRRAGNNDFVAQRSSLEDYVIGYTFPSIRAQNTSTTLRHDEWNTRTKEIPDGMGGQGYPIFATQSAVWYMPRNYRTGGPGNPSSVDRNNDEVYFIKIKVLPYSGSDGSQGEREQLTHNRAYQAETSLFNRLRGGPTVNQQLRGFTYNGIGENGALAGFSPYHIAQENTSYSVRTTGDAQTIIGNDVYINAEMNGGPTPSEGGLDHFFHWNTDSFRMTEKYARHVEVRAFNNGYVNYDSTRRSSNPEDGLMEVVWGVPKFTDNRFGVLLNRGKDDYSWYDTFQEAETHGKVGATMVRVYDRTGPGSAVTGLNQVPLEVISERIGSLNDRNTHNVVGSGAYVYYHGRDRPPRMTTHESLAVSYPTSYNSDGELLEIQSPVGSNVHYATLGVLPARVNSSLSAESSSVYSDQDVKWNVTAKIDLPNLGGDHMNVAQEIEIEHRLPQGLRYIGGSGVMSNSIQVNPEVRIHNDGTSSLIWRVFLPPDSTNELELSFNTSVNPQGLSGGNNTNMMVEQITHYILDPRAEHFRTVRSSINVLSLGQVGIQGELNPSSGRRNASYSYYIRPYTTSRDSESGVVGAFMIPYNDDENGSRFLGNVFVKSIEFIGREDITVYLHNTHQEILHPQNVDITSNGWRQWNGTESDLRSAGTLIFVIESPIYAVNENIEVRLDIQTEGNRFGDVYAHRSRINSNSNFAVSPQTIIERFRIVPDGEISLEHIRIDTQKAENGLVAEVTFRPVIHRIEGIDQSFTLTMYEINDSGEIIQQISSWSTTFYQSPTNIELEIPSSYLDIDQSKLYQVRIENVDTSSIQVLDGADRIDTAGYTSSEVVLEADSTEDDGIVYVGVIRTEREIFEYMDLYFESFLLPLDPIGNSRSGYGFEINQEITYYNDLDLTTDFSDFEVTVDSTVVDGDFYSSNDGITTLDLINNETRSDEYIKREFYLPPVYVEQKTGRILDNQDSSLGVKDGGNKAYIPIWIDELGEYDVILQNIEPLGIHEVNFVLNKRLNVFAYMYASMNSPTIEQDSILLEPANLSNPFPNGLPNGWIDSDLDWLQNN